jgi:hypothetical protein
MGGMSDMHNSLNGHDRNRTANTSTDLPSKEVFEDVLRETLLNTDQQLETSAIEMDLLIAVARRYPGEALRTEPIVSELVEALLKSRFSNLSASTKFWDEAADEIARTLMDDPCQNALLHGFWSKLCEKAA